MFLHKTDRGTNIRGSLIVKMDDKISPAVFCHICLLIWIGLVQEIAVEILRIKIKVLGEFEQRENRAVIRKWSVSVLDSR
jgi:hypothetical protein